VSTFHKAERRRAHIKLAITGPSGSGKTYSALLLAQGLGGKVAMIDTENGSGEMYSALCAYDALQIDAPFTVAKYNAAIKAAVAAGYNVLIIDSLTHAWAGEGGLLAQKEALDARGGNSYTNWATITKEHEQFKAALLQAPIHVVATMRSKQDYVLQANDRGKQVPVKVGMAPIQRDGMEYEFTTVFDVAMNHEAAVSKDRTGLFDGIVGKLSYEHGAQIAAWLADATAEPVAQPTPPPAAKPKPKAAPKQADTGPAQSTNDTPHWTEIVPLGTFVDMPILSYKYNSESNRHWYECSYDGMKFWCWYVPSTEKSIAAADANTTAKRIHGKLTGAGDFAQISSVSYPADKLDCPPVEAPPTADEAVAIFGGGE